MASGRDSPGAAGLPPELGRDEVMRYVLHEARGTVVGAGAVARMIRARHDGATSGEPARTVKELDLILEALGRLDALLLRARPLLRGRKPRRERVDLSALVAQTAARRPDLEVRAPRTPLELTTDPELLLALVHELLELARGEVKLQLAGAPPRIVVTGAGPNATPAASVALAIARAAAARLGARLELRRGRAGAVRAQITFAPRPRQAVPR
jgi:hypothetical protein